MALTSGARQKVFRRARIWVALLIAFALGAAAAAFTIYEPHGRALELTVSDTFRAMAALPDEAHSPVPVPMTVIGIDDPALNRDLFGHWPWSWDRIGEMVRLIRGLGARLIVLDIEFIEPDPPRVAQDVRPDGTKGERIVHTVPALRDSLRSAGNVLVPFSVYFEDRPAPETLGRSSSGAAASSAAARVPAALERHALGPATDARWAGVELKRIEAFQPMIPDLADACIGSGYTSIRHDDEDSKVRRVRLVARGGDRLFPHLMLEAAGIWRFGPDYQVRLEGERFYLLSPDGKDSVGVPVDRAAQMELRWPKSLNHLHRISAFPAVLLIEYYRHMAELDTLFDEGWRAARKDLEQAKAQAATGAAGAPAADEIRALEARVLLLEKTLVQDLRAVAGAAPGPQADERSRRIRDVAVKEFEFFRTYYDLEADKAPDAVTERVEGLITGLRRHVAGRICLIGSYATGQDLHATPIAIDVPGVTVYPAGIQTILSGVAFRHLDAPAEWALIILAAGLVVTTLHLATWRGVAATLVLSVLVVGAAAAASAKAAVLLPVAGPVLGIVMAFAGISTYRQLTEASGRRWLSRAFEQYLSPELLQEIQRDPESLRLGGERREITFLFTDIAGFTPMAERMEPERLVALLNHYLSIMTDIVLEERAKLDKYEGDAILALFGAPVPLPDHALRAVRAALAMQAAMPRINDDLVRMGLLADGVRLSMRIGCASGPAIVGNFGSERRLDYTAMGDTVNLGARLQEANRWLGSRILVPEATAAACGQAVLFRSFGPARIRGKAKPVVLYEPLAPEPAPADLRATAVAFGRAVDALHAGDLDAAEAALRDLLAARPDDRPALVLKERIAAIRAGQAATDDPWNLARPK